MLPWVSLVLLDRGTLRRYMPVAVVAAALLNTIVGQMA
ncbi:hypothetical protein J2T17_004941 [Paenibacillus mucilaginosus]